jgi:hypothetical protein
LGDKTARYVELVPVGKVVWSTYAKGLRNFVWLRYANEFHNIAIKAGSLIVRAFLLGRALELYFKAFLFSCGYGETDLKKKFRHNLKRLLDEAISHGLDTKIHISHRVRTDIEALNSVYTSKALEYFSTQYLLTQPKLPELGRLLRFAVALKKFLGTHIRKPT